MTELTPPRPNTIAMMTSPIVDRNRCEGKAACAVVCPNDVFELRKLTGEERGALSLRGRLKAWVHGGQQAFTVRAEACSACGLCISACPEGALYFAN